MREALYRTGQVADTLGTSRHLIRKLIEAGLIDAEQTPGGQNLVPHSELERLKKEGLPPVPASPEWDGSESEAEPEQDQGQRRRLLGPPSSRVVSSAEDVVVNENRLKDLKINREMEETNDWFRQRKKRNAQQKAEEKRATAEQAARAEADRQRKAWEDEIVTETLRALPLDLPPEIYFEIQHSLEEVLSGMDPRTHKAVVARSVANAVLKGIAPLQRSQQTSRAIEKAADGLPTFAKAPFTPTKWQVRAQKAAADAIARLPNDASYEDKLRVAAAAVQPISEEFEDLRLKEKILNGVWLCEGTLEEKENAREAVRKALAGFPYGTSERDFETAREQALKPFRNAIEERKAEVQKRQRVDQILPLHVLKRLDRLEEDGDVEFESFEKLDLAERLKPVIRRHILEKLRKTDLSDLEIGSLIEDFIDEYVDEHLE